MGYTFIAASATRVAALLTLRTVPGDESAALGGDLLGVLALEKLLTRKVVLIRPKAKRPLVDSPVEVWQGGNGDIVEAATHRQERQPGTEAGGSNDTALSYDARCEGFTP
ncbi:hypothetical protein BCV70DRAFT_207978 [Testicularia cyperi]|uniref:Uncharacterized protein n=1 Tax=Testicularia cyperi TaxID=1882483 RepID=A0A317XKJ8_9BASI|nr:hypothetical protein BCV70DRAFT_207978 [Testicularia cyperi]